MSEDFAKHESDVQNEVKITEKSQEIGVSAEHLVNAIAALDDKVDLDEVWVIKERILKDGFEPPLFRRGVGVKIYQSRSNYEVSKYEDSPGEPRYICLKRVGAGSQAEVFVAYDQKMDRLVAVKSEKLTSQSIPLQNEAQILSRLNHSTIPQVYDFIRVEADKNSPSRDYYIMEYLDKDKYMSLDALLEDKDRMKDFSLESRLKVILSIASALDYLRMGFGVMHGDMHVGNVFIDFHTFEDVKVVDFGFSHVSNDNGSIPYREISIYSSLCKNVLGNLVQNSDVEGIFRNFQNYTSATEFAQALKDALSSSTN